MPELSRFYGIVVRMFFNDHNPAHFHAYYGSDEAIFAIETSPVAFPRVRLVSSWNGHLSTRPSLMEAYEKRAVSPITSRFLATASTVFRSFRKLSKSIPATNSSIALWR